MNDDNDKLMMCNRISGVVGKKVGWVESCIFLTAVNFGHGRLYVLIILILLLHSPKVENIQRQILHFWKKIFTEEDNVLTG